MNVVELTNVSRKDSPIYYRQFYSGTAVLQLIDKTVNAAMDFQVEYKPTGHIEVNITALDPVDYPLLPLQKEIKQFIWTLASEGKLPN